ncbi:MAG: lysophospholipid acyltransferase family protein [Sphingomonas oligoaromativorans]|jgi:1-acyl-sn-glycerol-3-phosphate acyltransferase|uniref:lysophospholipid acyltransferase family protein n=1 Tax=Sphingomonas oligoaromativorans TaxID=575322 RepID=UPI0014221565|nr:lysophospholipid acyltransferase family protein [Sphingomonas oligoaromativorans]NIJ32956.1 1-acyl-sn-glycerol-3-phosphate acyltransferase [Sphingomonas oligoaromativorans]
MTAIRSVLFYLLSYVTTAVMVLAGIPVALASRRALALYARAWARILAAYARYILGVRLKLEGTMPEGPVLYAAKHESAYETLLLLALIEDPVIVLKREIADVPLFGKLTRRHGVIPVDRSASSAALRAMLSAADEARAQNRAVLIFPEGTRVPRGRRPKLQAGFAGLYGRLGLPVVPVATDAGLAWPRGFLKRPGIVRIRFGDVIPAGMPRKEIEAEVHNAINALND